MFPPGSPAQTPSGVRPWDEYRAILWIGDTVYQKPEKIPLFCQRLREMGINTGMVFGDADPKPMWDNQMPYYVENLVNRGLCLKFNSNVKDWSRTVVDWAQAGRPDSAFVRDICLDDPQWRAWARGEIQKLAVKHRDHQPLAYNLRDELSVTYSANPFDYDFNPICLAQFRDWLKTRYASLEQLNRQWDTTFKTWDEVLPFSTDQIKSRMAGGDPFRGKPDWQALQGVKWDAEAARLAPTRWNFSPWADFRSYMDLSLARALDDFRKAAHEIDPKTPVGIEGTQMPHAFGGYDLARLSKSLDWIEPYDIGNAREILASFMAGKPVMTTVFESDTDHAMRRLWHLLLTGDRGCLIWWSEDCIDWKSDDYALTAKARALAPVLKEMTSPLARLFLKAKPVSDPVFILYSQPSIQVDWLIESTGDGSTWPRRFSSYETDNNQMAKARNGWLKACQDLGWSPRFVSSEQIESGFLESQGNAVLILPTAWALSDLEVAQIHAFTQSSAAQRTVFFDATPGAFDEHGRLRTNGVFDIANRVQAGSAAVQSGGILTLQAMNPAAYASARLKVGKTPELALWMSSLISRSPFVSRAGPAVSVPPETRVSVRRYEQGGALLVAFERNVDYQMSEDLKQAGGNETLEAAIPVVATLSASACVYDLRQNKYLGETNRIEFTLNPWQPSLYALTKKPLAGDSPVSALNSR